jgi:predicted MFS family arabinose efflux permease
MVGIGAALSATLGGTLIQHSGYRASFLGLAGIALIAFVLLWCAIPETLPVAGNHNGSAPTAGSGEEAFVQ